MSVLWLVCCGHVVMNYVRIFLWLAILATNVATYNKTTKSVGKGSVSTFFITMYYWSNLIFK